MMDFLQYFLPLYSPDNFPKKILVVNPFDTSKQREYFERKEASAVIQMLNDDFTVGNCHCSKCNASIDPFDKFCRKCGAKIKGRSNGPQIRSVDHDYKHPDIVYIRTEDEGTKPT